MIDGIFEAVLGFVFFGGIFILIGDDIMSLISVTTGELNTLLGVALLIVFITTVIMIPLKQKPQGQ